MAPRPLMPLAAYAPAPLERPLPGTLGQPSADTSPSSPGSPQATGRLGQLSADTSLSKPGLPEGSIAPDEVSHEDGATAPEPLGPAGMAGQASAYASSPGSAQAAALGVDASSGGMAAAEGAPPANGSAAAGLALALEPSETDTAPHLRDAIPLAPTSSALLGPLEYISQTANNCGPASIVEVFDFWGIQRSQGNAQAALRGNNPYGMTTAGVPGYVHAAGMQVLLGTGGSQEMVKALIRGGFPVIVNQLVSSGDREFHYRPIDGFDDHKAQFLASDPFLGPNYAIGYGTFDQLWNYTGKRFMVIYPPDRQGQLNTRLAAAGWDQSYAEGAASAQPWQIPDSGGPPPATKPLLSGKDGKELKPAPGDWYQASVTVTLVGADPNGFGVATTSYQLDDAQERLYTGPLLISAPGKHTLSFRSVSYDGGHEQAKKLSVNIDSTAPVTTATLAGLHLTLAATDAGSGVAKTVYKLDGGPEQTYTAPVAVAPGQTVSYASTDQAGNEELAKTLPIPADASSPPPSVAAAVCPEPSGSPTPAACSSSSGTPGSAGATAKAAPSASAGAGAVAAAGATGSGLPAACAEPSGGSAPAACPSPAGTPGASAGAIAKASPSASGTPSASATASASASVAGAPAKSAYNVCPLYDENAARKSGGILAIRLRLCDSAGKNVSSPALKVTLQGIHTPPNGARPPKATDFRYDPASAGYELDVTTDGLGSGVYVFVFSVSGDPSTHLAQFRIQ